MKLALLQCTPGWQVPHSLASLHPTCQCLEMFSQTSPTLHCAHAWGRLHRWTPTATPPGCTGMASQPLHFWYQALFLQKTHEECGNVRLLSTWLISSTGKKQSKIIIIIKKKTAHNRAVQMLFFPRLVTELHTDLRSYGFSFFFATWKRKVLSPFPKLFLFCYNF